MQRIPEDVVTLGKVYGFSVEGYVNFEPVRLRQTALEATPLMRALKATQSAHRAEPAPAPTAPRPHSDSGTTPQ